MQYKIDDAKLNKACSIIAKALVIQEELWTDVKKDEELYIKHKDRSKLSKENTILQEIITQARVTAGIDDMDVYFNATGKKVLKQRTEWVERMIKGFSEDLIVGITNEEQLTYLNETAYRKGFIHGFDDCLKLNDNKADDINSYRTDLSMWRTEGNLNKISISIGVICTDD